MEAHGDVRIIREQGQMGRVKHEKILADLEGRSLRYRKGGRLETNKDEILYNKALDKTRTVSTEGLTDTDAESWNDNASACTAEALATQGLEGIADELLEVHGVAPGKKQKE